MSYAITDPVLGLTPIANTDAGITTVGGTSVPTPPGFPGMVVQAFDPTFGYGEFILLAGVASTAIGSVVIYNTTNYTTTLCPVTANLAQPVAVAMSANIASTTWGWYQIGGVAVVSKSTTAGIGNNVTVAVKSTGKLGVSASGKEIQGARTANSTVSATTTQQVVINRPHMQGRIT